MIQSHLQCVTCTPKDIKDIGSDDWMTSSRAISKSNAQAQDAGKGLYQATLKDDDMAIQTALRLSRAES